MSTTGWLEACRSEVLSQGWNTSCLDVLEAFPDRGATRGPPGLDFARLETEAHMRVQGLAQRIEHLLDGEIDREQAELFARRTLALHDLLSQLAGTIPEARVFRIGATQRMDEILAAPPPRALRVRALVDFYTSHAALLHHRHRVASTDPPSLEALALGVRWSDAVPGLEHARIEGESELGPLHINLLRAARPRLQALDCRRMAQGAGRDFVQQVARADAMAAISGGFFLYSEPDIEPPSRRTDPVGLLLRDGEVLSPPVFHRATLAQDEQGAIFVRRLGLAGTTLTWRDGSQTAIAACNGLGQLGTHPVAFNRAWGEQSPDHGGSSLAIVGHRVIALRRGALPIPLAGFVLALPTHRGHHHAQAPGARLTYTLPPGPSGLPLHNAVAAGPMLIRGGRVEIDLRAEDFAGTAPPATFSGDETFDHNLLPRLAAGLDEQGRLVLAAIDGRNFHRAPGLTLGATARLMQALGCLEAMNLDGGSSKRMVLRGKVLDLPTTELLAGPVSDDAYAEAPVRPVHSAVLLHYRTEKKDPPEERAEPEEAPPDEPQR